MKNDGDEILIFGLMSAIGVMSKTQMVLADGTFKCVLPGFSQLYVFHAVVKNNVSLPMLFCLVKGKDGETYAKLLQLVEELAVENGTTIFHRRVTLMCDFEASFINTVKDLYRSVEVKCCFFHFVKNLRTNASPVMTAIRRDGGKKTDAYKLAQKTKRRLMMMPLLPWELITPDLVCLILRVWDQGCPRHRGAFDGLADTVLRTYVGRDTTTATPIRPRFHPSLWSVSGRSIRTNNAAESVHSQLNPKVSGLLSIFNFLKTIEDEMEWSRKRIRSGCPSQSRAVIPEKNRLLAEELQKLLNGREGVLVFLDNCSSIVAMRTVREASKFVPLSIKTVEDNVWSAANKGLITAAAHGLYHRLFPEGQLPDGDVLKVVHSWSFKDLDPIAHEGLDEDENLSLVEIGPRKSFTDLLERKQQLFVETGHGVVSSRMDGQTRSPSDTSMASPNCIVVPTAVQMPMFSQSPFDANQPTQLLHVIDSNRNRLDFDVL